MRDVPGNAMRIFILVAIVACAAASSAQAQSRPTRFWNLTHSTISEFRMAPAGTTDWGADQCKNDRDGTVDPDERLRITGVPAGTYDVKLADTKGRICVVHGIKVEDGGIFSIEENDLSSCNR